MRLAADAFGKDGAALKRHLATMPSGGSTGLEAVDGETVAAGVCTALAEPSPSGDAPPPCDPEIFVSESGQNGDSNAGAEVTAEGGGADPHLVVVPQSDGWESLLESPLSGHLDSLFVLELPPAPLQERPQKNGDSAEAEASAAGVVEAQRQAWWAALQASRPGALQANGDAGSSVHLRDKSWFASAQAPFGRLLVRLRNSSPLYLPAPQPLCSPVILASAALMFPPLTDATALSSAQAVGARGISELLGAYVLREEGEPPALRLPPAATHFYPAGK